MNRELKKLVGRTLKSQNLGVLATLEDNNPYESLVAFISSEDLKYIVFTTAVYTRKYANLKNHPPVSFLVDTRSNSARDFHECVVVTALGNAREIVRDERDENLRLYLKRHPYLEEFVRSPSTRLFRIRVKKYIVVSEFQNVSEFNI